MKADDNLSIIFFLELPAQLPKKNLSTIKQL